MTLTIRQLTAADIEQIDPVLMAAFREPSFKAELQLCLQVQPNGWLVAQKDQSLVGMVGAVDYGSVAQVGLMAVHPVVQRQGIRQTLLEQLLRRFERHPIIRLEASAVGPCLYSKFGFVAHEETWVFEYKQQKLPLSSPQQISPLLLSHLAALSAFDSSIFGGDRQKLFTVLLHEIGERAFVTHDETGQINGYLFAQSNLIGPWVASTPDAAEKLLMAALSLSYNRPPIAITPGSNPFVRELLVSKGFRTPQVPSHHHMVRGSGTTPGQHHHIYGLAHFSFG